MIYIYTYMYACVGVLRVQTGRVANEGMLLCFIYLAKVSAKGLFNPDHIVGSGRGVHLLGPGGIGRRTERRYRPYHHHGLEYGRTS